MIKNYNLYGLAIMLGLLIGIVICLLLTSCTPTCPDRIVSMTVPPTNDTVLYGESLNVTARVMNCSCLDLPSTGRYEGVLLINQSVPYAYVYTSRCYNNTVELHFNTYNANVSRLAYIYGTCGNKTDNFTLK
jgi:hypothetical protein